MASIHGGGACSAAFRFEPADRRCSRRSVLLVLASQRSLAFERKVGDPSFENSEPCSRLLGIVLFDDRAKSKEAMLEILLSNSAWQPPKYYVPRSEIAATKNISHETSRRK